MRLKSLKLAGFKSFANPTTFTFKHDITAIVGPNGCGKSNVIDAIRWVLGETSAKQLRGGAMSDVIFAGVEGRAAKSLASVELVFEHTQDESHGIRHELNLYQELSLRRQVTKDGKSDYYINGQRVRRRDVVDVFLGTGLGARSYAVIEQGMIGRIVESSPMQLREFIEEGAGVSRYQVRRADTEKKLAETRDNLERLSDLQGELKKQHKTLMRQAESAKQYELLNEQLSKLHLDDLMRRLFESWQYHELKKGEHGKSAEKLSELEHDVNKTRRELDQLSARVAEAQWQKDDARDKYHNAQMAEQTAQHNFYTLNSQFAQNEEKIARLSAAHQEALTNITSTEVDLLAIDNELNDIAPKVAGMQAELDAAKNAQEDAQIAWQKQRDELNALTHEKAALETQERLAKQQQQKLKSAQEKWQKRHDELTAVTATFQDIATERAALGQQESHLEMLKLRLANLADGDELKALVDKLSGDVKHLQAIATEQEKQHASMMAEYDILHKLVHAKPMSTPQSDEPSDDAVLTNLANLKDNIALTVEGAEHADVLDQFLGFWLGAKIADDMPTAKAHGTQADAKLILKSGKVSDPVITASALSASETVAKLPKHIREKLLRFDRLFSTPTLEIFSRSYLYVGDDSLDDGGLGDEHLAELGSHSLAGVLIVTKAGWVISSFGMMHISQLGESGSQFLAERQKHLERLESLNDEMTGIEDLLQTHQKQCKQAQAELDNHKIELEELIAQKTATTTEIYKTEKTIATLSAKINADTIQRENHAKQKAQLDDEKADIDKEVVQTIEELGNIADKLEQFAPRVDAATASMNVLTAQIDAVSQNLKAQHDSYQALQLRHTALIQSKKHAERLLDMAKNSAAQTNADIDATNVQQDKLSAEMPKLEEAFRLAKSFTHDCKMSSDEYDAAAKVLQLNQAKLQEELTLAHAKFATAQAEQAQLTADAAVGESRVQDIGDELIRLKSDFNLPATLADFRRNPSQTFINNSAEQEEIKAKIAKLGAVNLAAAAELAEIEQRVSPMDEQIQDITESMTKLEDAIRAIDEKTKTLFLNALSSVNKELNALFSKVFGGGQASLSLMEDETLSKAEKWRAGLVLMAQPKGKKNSRLAVLSGGEKTLTALSLIFAIFKQHPAPFCVLDEVDAPLDDANVARFTGLIHELADDVQFIFISHNKLAMQTAHELKGITMPTAGISSLVTVNIEEAQKYLEV